MQRLSFKGLFALLAVGFAALGGAFPAYADDGLKILWWQVGADDVWDDDVALQGVTVKLISGGTTTAYDLGVTEARIRETTTGTYLKMEDYTAPSFDLDSSYVPTSWRADISAFDSGSPEYAFVIELGNYESGSWSMLAVSESATYTDLVNNGHIEVSGDYNPQVIAPWMPTAYVVPEPTSGVLVLVGAALLALRRRRGLGRANG